MTSLNIHDVLFVKSEFKKLNNAYVKTITIKTINGDLELNMFSDTLDNLEINNF